VSRRHRTFGGPLGVELVDVDGRGELGEGIGHRKEFAVALGKSDAPHGCSVRPDGEQISMSTEERDRFSLEMAGTPPQW